MSTQSLVFKNNLPNLTALQLFSQDSEVITNKLRQKFKQAPMMFIGMQLVIDVSALDREAELTLDLDALLDFLRGEGVNPIALMSDKAAFRERAVQLGIGALPTLKGTRTAPQKAAESASKVNTENTTSSVTTAESAGTTQTANEEPRKTFDDGNAAPKKAAADNQIVRHPVRSGQRLYARGDLTIIGAVSPGAEVIADGSIHVYGKLSGRAIAGAQGDETAAIFCQQLNAELVSIAGNYKQLEDIDNVYLNQRIQISLENEKICFFSL